MANASLQAVIHACLGDPDDAGLHPRQRQVCHHLLDCRNEALGGFCLECDQCQDRAFVYHACRDRHCPRCQRRASQDWCERQRAAVSPCVRIEVASRWERLCEHWGHHLAAEGGGGGQGQREGARRATGR